ncbi:hypothetical protein GGP41_002004 [Bipolaris sorokiniana]|uniref:Uncharacterized protein n=1 Tax=Cochliobolus sativus TaxID=45130 RepID=A0A8H6DZ98_COCSA|nr:hypothetical protein GGP41_002004 [Bipolaris sorokiniana]
MTIEVGQRNTPRCPIAPTHVPPPPGSQAFSPMSAHGKTVESSCGGSTHVQAKGVTLVLAGKGQVCRLSGV